MPVVSLKEVGQGFYRFFGFFCVALYTLAVGLALMMGPAFDASYHRAAWALAVSLLFTLCFTLALRVRVPWFLWANFWLAVIAGVLGIGFFPLYAGSNEIWVSAHFISSALLLGAVILAMMLGHWYLVIPKLSITPLKRYSALYIFLTLIKALELAAAWWLFKAGGNTGGEVLLRTEPVFALFRVAWGILPPLGMAYWIWETVRIRSTQSATGILYAALVCTLIGEGMGLFLTLQTGVPF